MFLLSSSEAAPYTAVTAQIGELVLWIQVGKQISLKEEHAADVALCLRPNIGGALGHGTSARWCR